MVAEKVGGAIEIPLEALDAEQEPSASGTSPAGSHEPAPDPSESEPPPTPRRGRKRNRKGGGWGWMQAYPFDLFRLDLHGLLQAMGVPLGPRAPYGEGRRFRAHCIRPSEHTDGKDDDGAVGFEKEGELPSFHCSHTVHCGELGLKDVLEAAGEGLVSRFAPPLDQEDLPHVSGGSLRRTNVGIFHYSDQDDGPPTFLCSPITIDALIRDGENGEWGLLCSWRDPDGEKHQEHIPRQSLKGDGAEVRGQLLAGGCQVSTSNRGRGYLMELLNRADVKRRARHVSKSGWHRGAFVLPNEVIGGDSDEWLVLDPRHRKDHGFQVSGSLQDWQNNIGVYAVGNSRVVFSICTGFSGPIQSLMGVESGGSHLVGPSSMGKSTLLLLAGSVSGGGNGARGFVKSWRSTGNGLEATAIAHNDGLLCLDEIGEVDSNEIGEIVYMLANGQQKQRARADGGSRPTFTWNIAILSTGEVDLGGKIQEGGKRVKAGQEVRLVDVPADAGMGLGIFETLHDAKDGASFSDRLRHAATTFYGTPLRAFLEKLVAQPNHYRPYLRDQMDRFKRRNCPDGADGQVQRVVTRFALIAAAGELATRLGILPWPEGEAQRGVSKCFQAWLGNRGGTGPSETHKGVMQVLQLLQAHASSRFLDAWEKGSTFRPQNQMGARKLVHDTYEFYVFAEAFKNELCKGFDSKRIAKALNEAGLIVGDGAKTSRSVKIPGHGSQRVYYFPRLPDSNDPGSDGGTDEPDTP